MGSVHNSRRLHCAAMCGLFATLALGSGTARADEPPQADTQPSVQPGSPPTRGNVLPAASGVTRFDAVVITANRAPTSAADVGSSATLITAEEIEQKQQPFVADVLRGMPGLDVVRSGGPSQITSVFMRGANSDHTLVLIDGIEANDPSSPTRAFDFSTLPVGDIDQIEVIRGPQSTLWGSNAIGGVINIVTRRGEGPTHGYFSSEAGSFNTFRESAGISGGTKFVNYSLNITENDSQGFPAADARYGNKTPDGFDNTSFASRLGFDLSENCTIDVITRYQNNRVRLDDGGGPRQDDPNRWLKSQEEFLRVAPHLKLFDGVLEQTYGFNYTHYLRDDTYRLFPSQNVGSTLKFDLENDLHLSRTNTLSGGVDLLEEGFRGTGATQKYQNTLGLYVQDQASFGDKLFLTGGARYEDNSLSGPNFTYRATAAYLLTADTKFHASYGTGFKSPTLFDIYSSFGSRDLKAEKSQGWDAGVEQSFLDKRVVLNATYFNNHFTNLIDFDFITNRENNVGEARAQGAEIGAAIRPTDAVTTGLNYTYTDTQDETTRLPLLRRPQNKVGAFVNYRYSAKGDVTLTATYVSSRPDIDPVTFGRTRVGAYTLVNLATSYKVNDWLELTARIDNLLNQHYQEVAGFGTADISFYAGLKLNF